MTAVTKFINAMEASMQTDRKHISKDESSQVICLYTERMLSRLMKSMRISLIPRMFSSKSLAS